jgi:hypothetical protein
MSSADRPSPMGMWREPRACSRRAWDCSRKLTTTGIITNLADLARVAAARGHPSVVIRLLAAVDALRRAGSLPFPDADRNACDRALAAARGQLDAATCEAAWSEGAAMTIERAVAHARTQVGDFSPT